MHNIAENPEKANAPLRDTLNWVGMVDGSPASCKQLGASQDEIS